MIRITASSDYIILDNICNDIFMPFDQWAQDEDATIYSDLINEFVDNGLAIIEEGHCLLSYDAVYQMTINERSVLSIPSLYPYSIYVQPKGLLKDATFQYAVSYRESKLARPFHIQRQGAIITIDSSTYLLPKEQFEFISAIDEFNVLPICEKALNQNLIAFSRIKELSQKSKIILDKYLQSEDVYVPERLKIEIEKTGNDTYDIVTTIDSPFGDQFSRYLKSRTDVPDNIAVSNEKNERTRIVLDDKKRGIIRNIQKNYKNVSSNDIAQLIENPALYLDTDESECDFSAFYSDRVIEIGVYKPKVYPFVSPFKSSWIPTYQIEDRVNGTSVISIETMEQLEELEETIYHAKAKGENYFTYKDTKLNIDDGLRIAKEARDKLEEHLKNEKQNKDKKVLIVEENAEELGYSVETKNAINTGKYTFSKIPGLRPEIKLKNHQIDGIAWLQCLVQAKCKGCLLADDMGLGKTLQLLSLISWYDQFYPANEMPYLIVAPVSLIENWEQEYEKFFEEPRIPVTAITGEALSRRFSKGLDKNLISYLQKRQIIITNYETIRSFQFSFCTVNYSLIILDEAQKIKTPGTLITNAAKALKGEFKIAMTGTPVENTLVDLWCIMDFSLPGLLGNCREFAKKYQSPLKNQDIDLVQLGNSVRKEMGNYFLRRLKSDVAKDLPQKYIKKIPTLMPDVQRQRYDDIITSVKEKRENSSKDSHYMLQCIQQLREVSDHPFLNEDWSEKSIEEIINSSAKMKALLPILNEIKEKREKVILFAERREIQLILKRIIRYLYELDSHIINGDTPTIQKEHFRNGKLSRQQAIDDFQRRNGFNVIIMSPIAAGMGLNVVGANHVVHYSRHWNPAKEEQATDRVYRIGQTKDVYIYYPMAITDGFTTFDQTLDKLLEQKSKLAEATLFPTIRIEVQPEALFNQLFSLE